MSIADEIRTNRDRYNAELARIRADRDLSDEARQRKICEAQARADERHRELIAQQQRRIEAESRELYKSALGLGFPAEVVREVHSGAVG